MTGKVDRPVAIQTSPMGAHADHAGAQGEYSKKKRVGKACDTCRIKKTKCNGKKPCDKCLQENRICSFSERRRDKEKHYPAGYIELMETRCQLLTKSLQKLVELAMHNADMRLFFAEKCPVVHKDPVSGTDSISINNVIDALVSQGLLQGEPVDWEEGIKIAADFDIANANKAINAFAEHSVPAALTKQAVPQNPIKQEETENPLATNSANGAATNNGQLSADDQDFAFKPSLSESNTFTSLSPVSSSSDHSDHSAHSFFQSTVDESRFAAASAQESFSPMDTQILGVDRLLSGTGSRILSVALNRNLSTNDLANKTGTPSDFASTNASSLFSAAGLTHSRSQSTFSNPATNFGAKDLENSDSLFFDNKKAGQGAAVMKTINSGSNSSNNSNSWNADTDKLFSPVDGFSPNLFGSMVPTNMKVNHSIPLAAVLTRNLTNELISPTSSPVLSSPVLPNSVPNDVSLNSPKRNRQTESPISHSNDSSSNHKLLRKSSDGHISKPVHHYHPHCAHPHSLANSHNHSHSHQHQHTHSYGSLKLPASHSKLQNKKPSFLSIGNSPEESGFGSAESMNSGDFKRLSTNMSFFINPGEENDLKSVSMFDDIKSDPDFTKTANEILNLNEF